MINITPSGRLADVVRQIRDIPDRVIPYAAATALTRTAKAAQAEILAQMPRVFAAPTRYTLGATRVVPATKDKMVARVAVKDTASTGTTPEHYLLPEVEGGSRRARRFELAMRYAGIIDASHYVAPGQGATLDGSGNLPLGEIRRVLAAMRGTPSGAPPGAAKRRKGAYFRLRTKAGNLLILRRDPSGLRAIMVAAAKAPQYRKRLPFQGLARGIAEREFATQFAMAAKAITSRRSG